MSSESFYETIGKREQVRAKDCKEFQARVALNVIKERKTIAELARQHQLDPKMIREWKVKFMEGGSNAFETKATVKEREDMEAKLYEKIGSLEFELDWLKKNQPNSIENLRCVIERDHPMLSIRRQCQLIGLPRSIDFYHPATESEENLKLMRLIDEQHIETPFYGRKVSRKMRHDAP